MGSLICRSTPLPKAFWFQILTFLRHASRVFWLTVVAWPVCDPLMLRRWLGLELTSVAGFKPSTGILSGFAGMCSFWILKSSNFGTSGGVAVGRRQAVDLQRR